MASITQGVGTTNCSDQMVAHGGSVGIKFTYYYMLVFKSGGFFIAWNMHREGDGVYVLGDLRCPAEEVLWGRIVPLGEALGSVWKHRLKKKNSWQANLFESKGKAREVMDELIVPISGDGVEE
ncbi:hypothetical protein QJS10_CPA09g00450 [Acorus calamus]|uniref:Uncharacterized protein n=1 Tax=Acorus calamus TaxID=4465 RepID=A0AAV9E831_ACOCL|nr:hypothetical protein QJS10_CPA09g00450 [Acorus calamus]